ncbi:MAG: transglutaminase domain-containing protein [bacterium]|nr:transglutaminase domain-containing protein [bacterium]
MKLPCPRSSEEDRIPPATRRVLRACLVLCLFCALLARALNPVTGLATDMLLLCCVFLLPVLLLKIRHHARSPWMRTPQALHVLFAVQVLVLAPIPYHGAADRLLILFTWFAVYLDLQVRGTQRFMLAGAIFVMLTPLCVLAAMASVPGLPWLLLFPIALLLAALALQQVSLENHRGRIERCVTRTRAETWGERGPDPATRSVRPLPAILLSLAVLLCMGLTYPLFVAIPRPSFNPARASLKGPQKMGANERVRSESQSRSTFPGDIRPGGALGWQGTARSYETLMTVRALPHGHHGGAKNVGALYLGALRLDMFTTTGLRPKTQPHFRSLLDVDDGAEDGWIEFGEPAGSDVLLLEIRHDVLRITGSGEAVLFIPDGTLALDLPALRRDPNMLVALPSGIDLTEVLFRARTEKRALDPHGGATVHARHPDARFLQLPAQDEDLKYIKDTAASWTRSATNDTERSLAIVEHLRQDFEYTTKTQDVPGTRGIVNFLRRKQGHCTSFAASAVLMFRSLGIPSRVVTGFLVDNYDEAQAAYVVSQSNGHAWIEAHFEGLGWIPFEPTAPLRRSEALREAREGLNDGLEAWSRTLKSDIAAWARSSADEVYFAAVLDTVLDAPRAARASFAQHPGAVAAFLAALILLGVFWRRSLRKKNPAPVPRGTPADIDLYASWHATLERLGAPRGRTQTLREWTRGLTLAVSPEAQAELPELVDLFYRAHHGPAPLEEEERERVRGWIKRLNQECKVRVS